VYTFSQQGSHTSLFIVRHWSGLMKGVPGLGLCGAQRFQHIWAWGIERLRNGAWCERGVICWPKGTPGGRAGGGACDSETAGQRFWVRVKEHGLTNWGGQVAAKGKGRNKNAHLRPEAGTTGARRAGSRP